MILMEGETVTVWFFRNCYIMKMLRVSFIHGRLIIVVSTIKLVLHYLILKNYNINSVN